MNTGVIRSSGNDDSFPRCTLNHYRKTRFAELHAILVNIIKLHAAGARNKNEGNAEEGLRKIAS
jgi:hypothetical protein